MTKTVRHHVNHAYSLDFFLYFMNIHEIIYMKGVTVYMYIDMMDNRIKA